jgi:hypothetical protein
MALQVITLRKLLRFFYATNAKRISLLREDIRNELKKADQDEDEGKSGGNFHVPFWSDAKEHAAGVLDLRPQTELRIKESYGRRNLYPLLRDGFLRWWNELRRRINEPVKVIRDSLSARYPISELKAVVRVENLLALRVGEASDRVVYPYFAYETPLTEEGAKLALWLIGDAFKKHHLDEIQILDVIRGVSYSSKTVQMSGDERKIFVGKYRALMKEWEKLRDEYP